MKRYIIGLSVLALSIFSASTSFSQSLEDLRTSKRIITLSKEELPKFSIQIFSTKTPPKDVSFVKNADVVYEYRVDGLIKYFVGKYATYGEANKGIKGVRDLGFNDAFVVNMSKLSLADSQGAGTANNDVVGRGKKKIEIDPNKEYVVQVGAYRYPLYITFFDKIGTIYEYRFNDKIFRYTTKPVKGTEIEAEYKKILDLGYEGAFIAEYSAYAPFRIE